MKPDCSFEDFALITCDIARQKSAKAERVLRRLISEFYNRGLVHGDLRDANVISGDDGCVKLVDFDWGGKDGEVISYAQPEPRPD
ncbi:hypothetical protein V8E54_013255 [Elaphomyces granulatus]